MFNAFKKSIALMLTLIFVMSLIPFSAMAESDGSSGVLKFQSWTHTQNKSGTKPSMYYYSGIKGYGVILNYGTGQSDRRAYSQLDLTGYEEILENEGTSVEVTLRSMTSNTYNIKNLEVYAMDDSTDSYAENYATYEDGSESSQYAGDTGIKMLNSEAVAAGLQDYENKGICLAVRSDAKGTDRFAFSADPASLVTQLKTGKDNSIVTFSYKPLYHDSTKTGDKSNGYIFHTYTDCGVVISYDKSKIDNKAYVDSVASEFSWADISDKDMNALSENLNLPSKYRGADITWASSNPDSVAADGTVKIAPGVRSATLTATFSYKGAEDSAELATATKDFVVSVVSEEAKTVTIPFINYAHARSDQADKAQEYSVNSSYGQHYIQAGGMWAGFAQFDLSEYEEILRNPNTKLDFKARAGNGFTSYLYDFKVYLAPDMADSYKHDTVTYNSAKKLGMLDTTRPVLAAESDGEKVSNGTWVTVEADKEALLSVLDESGTNALVSMYLVPVSGSQFRMKEKGAEVSNGGLIVTYYESEIDEKAYADEIESNIAWESITNQDINSVEDKLTTYYKGAQISWSSDKNVIKPNGELIKSRESEVSATLTATVSYKDYSFTKDFPVTVAKLMPVTKRIDAMLIKNIGVLYPDKPYPTTYDSYYMQSGVMYEKPDSGRGDVHVFLKFDLSDSLKELEAAQNVTLTLRNRTTNIGAGGITGALTVLSDRYDEWDGNITYNIAIDNGMYTDPGYGKLYGLSFTKNTNNGENNVYDYPELEDAIKKAVAADPDEGLVSMKLSSTNWSGCSFQSGGVYITISYYEEDLMTDAELQDAKKDKLQWTALTSQDIDNVVADIKFPATWYGAPVVWTSSDESVISSSGEVTIGNEAKNVTLTATVDGAVNTFNVRVPANKLAMQSEYTHTKEATTASGYTNGSNLNYSAAIVYANEDIEGTPDVIIATYDKDGLLRTVTVKENVTLKKGINCIPSKYHYEFKEKFTKAFVVDDIETLNPLGIAR